MLSEKLKKETSGLENSTYIKEVFIIIRFTDETFVPLNHPPKVKQYIFNSLDQNYLYNYFAISVVKSNFYTVQVNCLGFYRLEISKNKGHNF